MRALVLSASGLKFQPDYKDNPLPGQIPIRVLRAGICETDLQLVRGYMGFHGVLGHEFVGIAEEGKYAGQRVVGEINASCRNCKTCGQGRTTHCPHRTVLGILNHDGAFADRIWLPECNLHPVPDHVSNDAAVFTEPLAAAFQIPAQIDLSRFSSIIVLGDGRLGNLCSQVIAQSHSDLLVIGKHPQKLARLSGLGIRTALIHELTEPHIADLVVDCTGSASGFKDACRLVRPRGTIVLKTTVAGDQGPSLAGVVIDELNVVGSRCGPFAPALAAIASGQIHVENLITSRFPLESGVQAMEVAGAKDQFKVILDIAE